MTTTVYQCGCKAADKCECEPTETLCLCKPPSPLSAPWAIEEPDEGTLTPAAPQSRLRRLRTMLRRIDLPALGTLAFLATVALVPMILTGGMPTPPVDF